MISHPFVTNVTYTKKRQITKLVTISALSAEKVLFKRHVCSVCAPSYINATTRLLLSENLLFNVHVRSVWLFVHLMNFVLCTQFIRCTESQTLRKRAKSCRGHIRFNFLVSERSKRIVTAKVTRVLSYTWVWRKSHEECMRNPLKYRERLLPTNDPMSGGTRILTFRPAKLLKKDFNVELWSSMMTAIDMRGW